MNRIDEIAHENIPSGFSPLAARNGVLSADFCVVPQLSVSKRYQPYTLSNGLAEQMALVSISLLSFKGSV